MYKLFKLVNEPIQVGKTPNINSLHNVLQQKHKGCNVPLKLLLYNDKIAKFVNEPILDGMAPIFNTRL